MKPKSSTHIHLIVFAAVFALPVSVQATATVSGITISDFILTDSSVEFRIQGCFVGDTPPFFDNSLFFVNTTFNPGSFSNFDLLGADSVSYSAPGSPSVLASTGSFTYGDYFFLNFVTNFFPGQDIDETFSASWDNSVFDPSQVSELDVFWGASDLRVVGGGVYLTTVTVPEPSASMFALLMTAGFLFRRNRRS